MEAIRSKNEKLAELNLNLVEKDNAIFSLRGKILELNNILSLSEGKQLTQQSQIAELSQSLNLLKEEKTTTQEESTASIKEMKMRSTETLKQVAFLTEEIGALKNEIILLNAALEYSEQTLLTKELKIEVLGERLNKALTSKVFELQKYRSEFFGKLQLILGDRKDIKIVGDRFIIVGNNRTSPSALIYIGSKKRVAVFAYTDHHGSTDYYDIDGNSLYQSFLTAPLKSAFNTCM